MTELELAASYLAARVAALCKPSRPDYAFVYEYRYTVRKVLEPPLPESPACGHNGRFGTVRCDEIIVGAAERVFVPLPPPEEHGYWEAVVDVERIAQMAATAYPFLACSRAEYEEAVQAVEQRLVIVYHDVWGPSLRAATPVGCRLTGWDADWDALVVAARAVPAERAPIDGFPEP